MNLTTLARYKRYFGINNSTQDAWISMLIPLASRHIVAYAGHDFARVVHALSRLNGSGSTRLRLPAWPIVSVEALSIYSVVYTPSTDGIAAGYQNDERFLYLFGGSVFPQGFRNVVASWTSGYVWSESAFIPANPGPYTITPSEKGFAADNVGVVNTASGVALTEVGSAPATGQYSFSSEGVYTFAAADAGVQVTMTYDYVPGSVELAMFELVGLKGKQRDNLGVVGRTLAGESVTYEQRDMTPSIKRLIEPYVERVPV